MPRGQGRCGCSQNSRKKGQLVDEAFAGQEEKTFYAWAHCSIPTCAKCAPSPGRPTGSAHYSERRFSEEMLDKFLCVECRRKALPELPGSYFAST
jgi:hypothetical protein